MMSKTYVLVHGAWHGAWVWEETRRVLVGQGHKVHIIDLPNHRDETVSRTTFISSVKEILVFLNECNEKVVLVGHGFAGMIISQVAEVTPLKIDRLIFVAAWAPHSNRNILAMLGEDNNSLLLRNLTFSEDNSFVTMPQESLKDVMYNDLNTVDVTRYLSQPFRQATDVLYVSVRTTLKNFKKVPKTYIVCLRDKVFSAEVQRRICHRIGCDSVINLDSGHVPMLSQPVPLATAMMMIKSVSVL